MAKNTIKLPKKIYLYVFDRDRDGSPLFTHTDNINDIQTDGELQPIGEYQLIQTSKLEVTRQLRKTRLC